MADMMYGSTTTVGDLTEENVGEFYGGLNNANNRQRFPGLCVGNLTWWTTDQDVINAINSIGITDVQEVKFFENRNNGQSKGFCVVTFGSESSLPVVMEKLPKLELYGQNPKVTLYNRQNLNLFESQTNKIRPQMNTNNGLNVHTAGIMGISSISGVHASAQGIPYSGLNSFNQQAPGLGVPRNPSYHNNMRMQMRAPRPVMRGGPIQNPLNPQNHLETIGHSQMMLASGDGSHQSGLNRMRFNQPQVWNNSQTVAYNPTTTRPQPSRREKSHSHSHSHRSDERGRSRSTERSRDRSRERSRDRSRERSRDRKERREPSRERKERREPTREHRERKESSRERKERRDHSRERKERRDRSRERKERRDRDRRERY